MVSPCCCSLQTGTGMVAIFQIIGTVVTIIFDVFGLIHLDDKKFTGILVALIVISIIVTIFAIFLGILLFIGSKNRDIRHCKVWFNVTLVLTLLVIISTVWSVLLTYTVHPSTIVSVLLNIYYLWVVYAFMDEIKSGLMSSLIV